MGQKRNSDMKHFLEMKDATWLFRQERRRWTDNDRHGRKR